jgi:hypothetical protein
MPYPDKNVKKKPDHLIGFCCYDEREGLVTDTWAGANVPRLTSAFAQTPEELLELFKYTLDTFLGSLGEIRDGFLGMCEKLVPPCPIVPCRSFDRLDVMYGSSDLLFDLLEYRVIAGDCSSGHCYSFLFVNGRYCDCIIK